jgi:hypothetical protein
VLQSSAPNLQTVAEQPVIRQAVDISGNAVEVGADALPRGNGSGKSGPDVGGHLAKLGAARSMPFDAPTYLLNTGAFGAGSRA